MAATDPATSLPTTWGAAHTLVCEGCGVIHYPAREKEKAEDMEDFHDTFCGGAELRPRHGAV